MQKLFLIIVSVLISFSSVYGENNPNEPKASATLNYKVTGIVLDKTTGEALAGVKVIIEESNLEVYTNFEGKFEFNSLLPGEYSISCKMVTYEGLKIESIKIGNNTEQLVTVKLKPVSEKPMIKWESPVNNMFAENVG